MGKKTRKKTGGRKKGTPNKSTLLLKDLLEDEGIDPLAGLKECLKELDGITVYDPETQVSIIRAKANIYMDLLQYLFPKRKSVENKNSEENNNPKVQIVKVHWADEGEDVYSSAEDEATDPPSNSDQPK